MGNESLNSAEEEIIDVDDEFTKHCLTRLDAQGLRGFHYDPKLSCVDTT